MSFTFSEVCDASFQHGESNECAVKAIAIATDVEYNTVHSLLRKRGRTSRKGTFEYQWMAVLKTDIAVEVSDVTDWAKRLGAKTVRTAERVLSRRDPKGIYLVRVRRHIAAFRDGELHDWSQGRQHRVVQIFRITPTDRSETMAKKRTAKTTAKKTTVAPKTTPATPAKKKDGLRKPQVRIIKAMAKTSKALTRKEVASKSKVDQASLVEYLGSPDAAKRVANDKKHFKSLISLKFVKQEEYDIDGRNTILYSITAAGKKAAAAA